MNDMFKLIGSRSNYPIIIGGFYRSGTTLLRRILDSHSNIHCGPEVKFFKDFYGDFVDDNLAYAHFFRTVRSLGLTDAELLPVFGGAFIKSHELAAKKSGKKRWADKAPENVLYLEEWNKLLNGKFFFIHVIRHPLDALSSLIEIGFTNLLPPEFEKQVQVYRDFLERGIKFAGRNRGISLTVKYEDLVTAPEETTRNILGSIKEKFEPGCLTDYNNKERMTGLEDPKIRKTTSIHTQSINRWERDLNKEQIRTAKEILSDLSRSLGYQI